MTEGKRLGLPVKLGLEVDFQPERVEEMAALLAGYPWDFLLGSIHVLDGFALDSDPSLVDALGPEEAWRRYFDWLTRAARSGLVDILAHPDLVRFFGNVSPPASASADYDELCRACAETRVCLEVSSAGLRKPLGEVYPHPELLSAARRHGVPITLASDAHDPQTVGRDLECAVEQARAAGYATVTIFEGRRARQAPLG